LLSAIIRTQRLCRAPAKGIIAVGESAIRSDCQSMGLPVPNRRDVVTYFATNSNRCYPIALNLLSEYAETVL
jgi:hypothetical protein